jgi:hypothetical protein
MNITEEIIDSFLRGDLSGAELEAFNKALASDLSLQQDVSIQSDIVDSIKQHRHQQLKNRLNAIDMKPTGFGFFSSGYAKLAASVGVVALLIGGYTLLSDSKNIDDASVANDSNTKEISTTVQSTDSTVTLSQNTTNANEIAAANADKNSINLTTTSPLKKSVGSKNNKQQAQQSTTYQEPNAETSDVDYNTDELGDNITMPSINTGGASASSTPNIKVNIVKEQDLGYRFYNNQLFLHGNFTSSTYELYELNNKPSKQLFLYFESNYYELIQGKTKVTKLSPITDEAVLAQLIQLRTH